MVILISWNLNSYSKFEVLTLLVLNNTYDVIDFDSPVRNIYKDHQISMIRIQTLTYSLKDNVFALSNLLKCLFLTHLYSKFHEGL